MKKLLIVCALIALSGCSAATRGAVLAPAPTPEQVQGVRHLVDKAAIATEMVLTLADKTGEMIGRLPTNVVLTVAEKNKYQCALVKTFGTTTQATTTVYAACGPTPLASVSPFTKAVEQIKTATTCPGLTSSAAALLSALNPLIVDLEQSPQQAVALAGVSFRVGLAYVSRLSSGGEPCR